MTKSKVNQQYILYLNGTPTLYVPNTLTVKLGLGTTNVRTEVNGSVTETVHSDDATERKSMVKFDVIPKDLDSDIQPLRLISSLKQNTGSNSIQLVSQNGNVVITLSKQSLINDPEANLSSDGVISLEFEGDPAILN